MKILINLFLIIVFMTTITACKNLIGHDTKAIANEANLLIRGTGMENSGTDVGNGMRTYFSKIAKYSVSYNKNLTLTKLDKKNIRIDNSNLVQEDNRKSFMTINFVESDITEINKLLEFLKQGYPDLSWSSVTFPGANGYFSENKIDNELVERKYFILTINNELIKIETFAIKDGNGLTLITPIVQTFTYDTTPPIIHEIKFDRDLRPGTNKIYLRITDNYSGVSLGYSCPVIFKHESIDKTIYACGSLKKLDADWYSLEFQVNKYYPDGKYTLWQDIWVDDNEGNLRQWTPTEEISLNLTGTTPDITPPVIYEIKIDSNLKPGTNKLYLRMSDNYSGIYSHIDCPALFKHETVPSKIIGACGELQQLEGDWYSIELNIHQYLPKGKYTLWDYIEIVDNANNITRWTPSEEISVILTDTTPDITPPIIHEIKIDRDVKPGTNKLYLRITDDYSGVSLGYSCPLIFQHESISKKLLICGYLKRIDSDWYSLEFKVDQYLPGGKYTLSGDIWIQDEAENQTKWWPSEEISVNLAK